MSRFAAPTIDALAKEYGGKVKVGKLDFDSSKIDPRIWVVEMIGAMSK